MRCVGPLKKLFGFYTVRAASTFHAPSFLLRMLAHTTGPGGFFSLALALHSALFFVMSM